MSAYTIKLTNGQDLVTIQDGMADATHSSITLFGKNFAGYGLLLNENQVKLLENFSFHSAPHFPLKGQLWWDSQTNQLKVYRDYWKTVSGPTSAPVAPTSDTVGDLWWNTTDQQLKVWNGSTWNLVGPSYTTNQGVSGQVTATVQDSNSQMHTIVQFMIGGTMVGILSKDPEFPIITIPGYSVIKPGFNLPVGAFVGNSENALRLGGSLATNFLRGDQESTTNARLNFRSNDGFQLGLNDDLDVNVNGTAINFTSTVASRDMKFYVNVGSIPTLALSINGATGQVSVPFAPTTNNGIANKKYVDDSFSTTSGMFLRVDGTIPIQGNITVANNNSYALGAPDNMFNTIYSTVFNGAQVTASAGNFATVTINGPITADTSAATKLYVDTVGTSVANAAAAALAQQRTSIVGAPPSSLNTIEKLSTAINNDPSFYTSTMTQLALLAPKDSPIFVGAPKAPTIVNIADSSDKIATTAFVRAVAASIASDVNSSLSQYAPITSPSLLGRPQAPTALPSEETIHPAQIATLSYVSNKVNQVVSTTITNQFAPLVSPAFTGNSSMSNLSLSGELNVSGKATFSKDVIINGNLAVNGTTTIVNTSVLDVADLNITVAKNAATAAAANGAGLTVAGPAAATMVYSYADDSWTFNKTIKAPGFVGGTASSAAKVDIANTALPNVPVYPIWATAIGSTALSTTSTALSFIPQTGAFTATSFNGSGVGLTNIQNSATSATPNNTGETIVMRDANKNFSANTITATSFVGSGSGLTSIPNNAINSTPLATPNTIVSRDANSNFAANVVSATSTSAYYADLAEMYVADAQYEPGTVLDFGGEKEVTLSTGQNPTRVAGVVSTAPAYLMNDKCQGEFVVALALQGRVPCKVIGMVQKGDLLVSYGDGIAKRALEPKPGTIIGKALEAHNGEASLIEISVSRC